MEDVLTREEVEGALENVRGADGTAIARRDNTISTQRQQQNRALECAVLVKSRVVLVTEFLDVGANGTGALSCLGHFALEVVNVVVVLFKTRADGILRPTQLDKDKETDTHPHTYIKIYFE